MRHGGPATTPRVSLLLSALIFVWGMAALAAEPAEPGAAAPSTSHAPRTTKHKRGKGAPSASAEELAGSSAPSADVAPPRALSAGSEALSAPPSASIDSSEPSPSAVPEPLPSATAAPSVAGSAVTAQSPGSAVQPTPMPSASSSGHAASPSSSSVKIHDAVVFALKKGFGGKSPEERARSASEALDRALDTQGSEEVRVQRQGDAAVIFAGSIPIVDLYADDAQAAGAADLDAYAADIAGRTREAIVSEKKRSAIAGTVFSLSLVIFFGLIAFYVLRKIGEFFERARKWALDDPDRISGIKFQSQVVVGPAAARGGVLVALILGRSVAQVGVVYVWLVFSLSLFQSTRPYTEKLTGLVTTPLSSVAGRFAASLPVVVIAAFSGVAVYVLLRFVQLFFEGVERRQTTLAWLPADLAQPTSVLVRVGIVVTALVFGAPIVTGDQQGAIVRTGTIALLALGVASTPLLASLVVGGLVVYGRRIRVGQHAELGRHVGKVLSVGLVDVVLLDPDGCQVRVPHLTSLVHPTRILGEHPRIVIELAVAPSASPATVQQVLKDAGSAIGNYPTVELSAIDADAQHYRITVLTKSGVSASDVRIALADALKRAGVALGRSPRRVESA